jgi:hypothetical protein
MPSGSQQQARSSCTPWAEMHENGGMVHAIAVGHVPACGGFE